MKINKKLSILSLLIISPSLMAAYSRYTSLDQYYDLSFTVECLGELDEGYKTYEFTIKNTGKGYIPYYEAFKYKASEFGSTSMSYQDDHLFGYSGLIAPNKEFKITYKTNSEFTQFEEGSFSTYAYKNPDNSLNYQGTKNITYKESNETRDFYEIDCTITNLQIDSYEYFHAITMNYDGKEYCSLCEVNENKVTFSTKKDAFDISKATITKIISFSNEKYNGPNYGAFVTAGMLYALIITVVVSIVIFSLIFFPIFITKRIRNKKAKN